MNRLLVGEAVAVVRERCIELDFLFHQKVRRDKEDDDLEHREEAPHGGALSVF